MRNQAVAQRPTQYRFGGSIPESVQRLKARREYRSSGLYATVKRARASTGTDKATSLHPSCEQMAALAAMRSYLPGSAALRESQELGSFRPGQAPNSSR